MEIDLDNLVFNGLEEAEKRNAERFKKANKKLKVTFIDSDCEDTCKI